MLFQRGAEAVDRTKGEEEPDQRPGSTNRTNRVDRKADVEGANFIFNNVPSFILTTDLSIIHSCTFTQYVKHKDSWKTINQLDLLNSCNTVSLVSSLAGPSSLMTQMIWNVHKLRKTEREALLNWVFRVYSYNLQYPCPGIRFSERNLHKGLEMKLEIASSLKHFSYTLIRDNEATGSCKKTCNLSSRITFEWSRACPRKSCTRLSYRSRDW